MYRCRHQASRKDQSDSPDLLLVAFEIAKGVLESGQSNRQSCQVGSAGESVCRWIKSSVRSFPICALCVSVQCMTIGFSNTDKPLSRFKLKLSFIFLLYFVLVFLICLLANFFSLPNKHQIVSRDETCHLQWQSAAFHSLTLVC